MRGARHRCLFTVLICCISLASISLQAQPRLNLPQKDEVVTLSEANEQILRRLAHDAEPAPKDTVAPDSERALLASLPPDLVRGCTAMIDAWGRITEGKSRLTVRDLGRPKGFPGRFLAFRCASAIPDYVQYFDERLVLLYEPSGKLALRIFAHGADAENDSTLSHIAPAGSVRFPGVAAAGFQLSMSNDNPCCDGGDHFSEMRTLYIVLGESGAYIAASLLRERTDDVHDDIDGDTEVRLTTEWKTTSDAQGQVTGFSAHYREIEKEERNKDAKVKAGEVLQRWNAVSRCFDTIKPPPNPLIQR